MKHIDHHSANLQWTKLGLAAIIKDTKEVGDWDHPAKLGKNQPEQVKTWQSVTVTSVQTETDTNTHFRTLPQNLHPSAFLQELNMSVQRSSALANISITTARLSNPLPSPPPPLQPSGGAKRTTHKRCDSCVKRADIHV